MKRIHNSGGILLLSAALAGMAGCGGDDGLTVPPTTGAVEVIATTTGAEPDADGYSVSVDGEDRGALAAVGSTTLNQLSPGSHSVGLSGVAANCEVEGDNPIEVAVTAGASTSATFIVTCTSPPPNVGTLRIITATNGPDADVDGYAFAVDGGATQPISVNATSSLSNLAAGSHSVTLSDVASNCVVQGNNPRAVDLAAGATADASFTVTCAASTGSVEVTTTTSGSNPDTDGYSVKVDAGSGQLIAPTGTHRFDGVSSGEHRVELSGVAAGCSVEGENPRTVQVSAGSTVPVAFSIICSAMPLTSLIAFASNAFGLQAIFVVSPDGTGLKRLSPEGAFDSDPVWSPDRQKILFSSGSDLYVMNADGSGRTPLVQGQGFHSYRWSPDGGRIAFVALVFEGEDVFDHLWVMQADGTGQTKLVEDATSPTWSPDGTGIAYAGTTGIRVINPDGNNDRALTSEGLRAFQPAWSPDGTRIAFVTIDDKDIFVINPDGSGALDLSEGENDDDSPTWSPDGKRIAFNSSTPDQPLDSEVAVMNPDGTGRIILTAHAGFDYDPDWSPDNAKIVYTRSEPAGGDSEIFVMSADGTGQTNVSNRPASRETTADWSSGGQGPLASNFGRTHVRWPRETGRQ